MEHLCICMRQRTPRHRNELPSTLSARLMCRNCGGLLPSETGPPLRVDTSTHQVLGDQRSTSAPKDPSKKFERNSMKVEDHADHRGGRKAKPGLSSSPQPPGAPRQTIHDSFSDDEPDHDGLVSQHRAHPYSGPLFPSKECDHLAVESRFQKMPVREVTIENLDKVSMSKTRNGHLHLRTRNSATMSQFRVWAWLADVSCSVMEVGMTGHEG